MSANLPQTRDPAGRSSRMSLTRLRRSIPEDSLAHRLERHCSLEP